MVSIRSQIEEPKTYVHITVIKHKHKIKEQKLMYTYKYCLHLRKCNILNRLHKIEAVNWLKKTMQLYLYSLYSLMAWLGTDLSLLFFCITSFLLKEANIWQVVHLCIQIRP